MNGRRSTRGRAPQPRPHSAGILLYRETPTGPRVLLAHPGGPFFAKKDAGAWSIPKGLIDSGEEPEAAARREFEEECGWRSDGDLAPLGEATLRSGKRVIAFALRVDDSEDALLSKFAPGRFTMQWPPRSGKQVNFPEVDRIEFFSLDEARTKINPAQAVFLDRLADLTA
jgi:predicted NUDIX family NTP pyrophosphohydrolase